MTEPNFRNRTLYHGDNLAFLRGMNSETVHLIATDPPFNKNRDFHATPDSLAAGARFRDRWRWDEDVHEEWTDGIIDDWPAVWEVITAARASYGDDMGAFLCWLGVRLMEMHRVLRPDGALYLHIDYDAYAYVKALLDSIFGKEHFRNEIVWAYGKAARGAKGIAKQFARNHDTVLFYSRSRKWAFNPQLGKRLLTFEEARKKGFRVDDRGWFKTAPRGDYTDESVRRLEAEGRIYRTRTGNVRIRYDLPVENDKVVEQFRHGSVWDDIGDMMHAPKKERTGYPTQKPLALYRRIIEASSNEGDIVLDPFCGCATTPVAAEQLERQWVGMDIWDGARDIVLRRLQDDWLFTQEGAEAADAKPMFPHEVTIENTPPRSQRRQLYRSTRAQTAHPAPARTLAAPQPSPDDERAGGGAGQRRRRHLRRLRPPAGARIHATRPHPAEGRRRRQPHPQPHPALRPLQPPQAQLPDAGRPAAREQEKGGRLDAGRGPRPAGAGQRARQSRVGAGSLRYARMPGPCQGRSNPS
ncbi:MAG: DNA methyltransferase [Anaerolineaceae bacterium]|nr:DNA methyltransferase [Anaerolineaceae bacterium]